LRDRTDPTELAVELFVHITERTGDAQTLLELLDADQRISTVVSEIDNVGNVKENSATAGSTISSMTYCVI
jgi:hypothetical protein